MEFGMVACNTENELELLLVAKCLKCWSIIIDETKKKTAKRTIHERCTVTRKIQYNTTQQKIVSPRTNQHK